MDEHDIKRIRVFNLRDQPLEIIDGQTSFVIAPRRNAEIAIGAAGAGQLRQLLRKRLVSIAPVVDTPSAHGEKTAPMLLGTTATNKMNPQTKRLKKSAKER